MKAFLIHIALVFSVLHLAAQSETVAVMALDTTEILIGEPVKLTVEVEYRVDGEIMRIDWPSLKDTLPSKIEILLVSKIDTALFDKQVDPYLFVQRCELQITSFDTGYLPIHPLLFRVNGDSLLSNAVLLHVSEPLVDETADFMDIKPIEEVKLSFMDWLRNNWMWLSLLPVAALLGYFIIRKIRQKNTEDTALRAPEPEPTIPAHVLALQEIERLSKEGLWQQGKFKIYHSRLNTILREYLENRYGIHAMEETTSQIIRSLDRIGLDVPQKAKLRSCLVLADLVKFAKEKPLAQENETALINVREFVELTASREEIA